MNYNNDVTKIDSISDTIYWLSPDIVLKFTVSLARQNPKDKTRRYFHNEVERDGNYSDVYRVVTINREINYYMSISSISNSEVFTMIRVQDILMLRDSIIKVQSWFKKKIFVIREGILTVEKRVSPVKVLGLAKYKSLEFEPTILRYNEESIPGIRITFLPSNIFTDISVDKFMGFVYLINTIDMHSVALSMYNYIGAPPLGTNLYSCKTNNVENTVGDGVSKAPTRRVNGLNNTKSESYFNKMRRLEND